MTGVAHLAGRLSLDEQRVLVARCLALGAADAGFYTPLVRGLHPMSVRMLCLGRHWNAVSYAYEAVRSDVDGRDVPPLPPEFVDLAYTLAAEAGFSLQPDICIVNWYGAGSKMGLHQDKDESAASIARGAPVVSISLTAPSRSAGDDSSRLRRCVRVRRSRPAAVSRRRADHAGHGAGRPGIRGTAEPDLQGVLTRPT